MIANGLYEANCSASIGILNGRTECLTRLKAYQRQQEIWVRAKLGLQSGLFSACGDAKAHGNVAEAYFVTGISSTPLSCEIRQ